MENPFLRKCEAILIPLTQAVSGLVQGLFYLAKVNFISGKKNQAKNVLNKVLDMDPEHNEAKLLLPAVNLFYFEIFLWSWKKENHFFNNFCCNINF